MGNLITASGFEKALGYAERFKEGLIVTVLLALFTVIFGFGAVSAKAVKDSRQKRNTEYIINLTAFFISSPLYNIIS